MHGEAFGVSGPKRRLMGDRFVARFEDEAISIRSPGSLQIAPNMADPPRDHAENSVERNLKDLLLNQAAVTIDREVANSCEAK